MKILCISDLIDPLVYSDSIKERFSGVDMVLCAGDLPMDYLDYIISNLNIPLLFVFGNHHIETMKYFKHGFQGNFLDYAEGDNHCCGAIHTGSKVLCESGLIVAGLGGSMRYNRGANQFTDSQMYMEIFKLLPKLIYNRIVHGRYVDVLLTHAPPKGIHDRKDKCHNGFKAFRWFMKKFKPRYLVHGHIHLYDLSEVRVTQWEGTTVVNAYGHCVISLDEEVSDVKR